MTRPRPPFCKGTVSTLRAPLFAPAGNRTAGPFTALLRALAADPVPDRPNRIEPRTGKRRSQCYQLLTRPRHLMIVSASRTLIK